MPVPSRNFLKGVDMAKETVAVELAVLEYLKSKKAVIIGYLYKCFSICKLFVNFQKLISWHLLSSTDIVFRYFLFLEYVVDIT